MARATINMVDDNNMNKVIEYEINTETHWEAIDYYIPCNGCGKLVFHSTTEIIGDYYMCPNCRPNLDAIASKAEDAFWEVVAVSFPDIPTGDLSIVTATKLSETMREAVKEWYNTNKPAEAVVSPYKEFKELELHFGQEWEIEQTGDNVFIAYLIFYSFDREARIISVSSDCIRIINKPWTPEQSEEYAWFFGDNPTAFFCTMENYARHQDTFDFGKLFDDCQIIAKSGLV